MALQHYEDMVPQRASKELFLYGLLAHIGRPGSYLEVGCQDGWLVRTMRQIGARPSLGIEFDVNARKYARKYANILINVEQRESLSLRNRFGLVMAIGTDARIEDVQWLADSLADHITRWMVVAPCTGFQWQSEMLRRGVALDSITTDQVRMTLQKTLPGTPMEWLVNAVQVYRRG